MNTDLVRRQRCARSGGFTLVEAMVSVAILGWVILALIAGTEVASNGNAFSRRRTLMVQFAQSRMEQLVAMTRPNIPTATTSWPVNCSAMTDPAGGFSPNAAPGTGGWMLDVIYGQPPSGSTSLGEDLMGGPWLVEGDRTLVDQTDTLSERATAASNWFTGADTAGCGSTAVTSNKSVLCREIHIEPYDVTAGTTTVHMLGIWIRVVRGGTTNWQNSNLTIREDISQ